MTKTKTKEKSLVTVIHPNGDYDVSEMSELTLTTAQALCGGLVQIIPLFNKFEGRPCVAMCDEEGKLKGYPTNTRATVEWAKAAGGTGGDYLVGPVVIVTGPARKAWG